MFVTIDRFEGDFAVVELPDKTLEQIPKRLLPDCLEGDIIEIKKDTKKTNDAKQKANENLAGLFE